MGGTGIKGAAVSFALHVAAFSAVFFLSAKTKSGADVSAADPLLAMLADPDADPTKDAGLVGEKRGLAAGTLDGDTLEKTPPDFASEEIERLNREADEALATPLPEPEAPEEPAPAPEPVPAAAEPAKAEPVSVPAEKSPKPAAPEKKSGKTPAAKKDQKKSEKISFKDWQKSNAGKGKLAQKPKKTNAGSGGGVKVARIDPSKIGVAGGSGNGKKTFGVPDGTGGNGGDGGRAVASAQQAYAAEVAGKLASHLDGVLTQAPLKLEASVSVTVRLGVDARGNVRLLDVLGTSDPQVRDRVAKAVARLGKFRAPPEGRAFDMSIPDVVLRPL